MRMLESKHNPVLIKVKCIYLVCTVTQALQIYYRNPSTRVLRTL